MKFKKITLVLILFSGIIGCDCFTAGSEWNIDSFNVSIFDKNGNLPLNGIIEGDSIKIQIMFEPEFVEFYSNPFKGLMNSALATSCEEPGDNGLKDKIENFFITSNSEFNEIPIGESLNEFIIVNNRKKSIADWISTSDTWMFRYGNFSELVFIEKPEISSTHIFTLKFVLESGNTIEQSTEEIQWN